nr:MAG TPA: hypothetical protein [Caudoviricetes sp.]
MISYISEIEIEKRNSKKCLTNKNKYDFSDC